MKPKLMLVIPTLDQGGAEKQICLLADGLLREQWNVQIVVLTRTGPREAWLVERNIPVHFIGKRGKVDPFAWRRLRDLFVREAPDIVHTWLFAANAYGRSAALSARVPVIAGSERSVDPWKSSWQFWIDRWLAKKTKRMTTNSPGVVRFYGEHGIPAQYFSVIPNAVTPPSSNPISREEAARRLGIDSNRKWIFSVGRLWPQKGYKDLIWAAEMIRVHRENTSYVILGEGPERKRLELYRDNTKAASDVHLVGERSDVQQLLPHAEMLWNGSLYEGQSNVILEAMQFGVPVIATDIPGNHDLIQSEHSGLLYKTGDIHQLCRWTNRLLDSEAYRSQLIRNALARIEDEHTLDKLISRHACLYELWLNQSTRNTYS